MTTRTKQKIVAHKDVLIPFNNLHFDPINPRGVPEPDEEKVRFLFGSQKETAVLATHIATHGINPLDRLGIIDHPKLKGHFVVREGNRRLCAMQLLRDPERAPNPAIQKSFQRLAKGPFLVPDKVQAVLFMEPPKARVWMSVKHEGPQNGLGTLTWGTTQMTRFNREGDTGVTRPKNPNLQAEALLTYAESRGLITHEERALMPITTITRYLPNVRTTLALLNSVDCTTNATIAEFDRALKRFLQDTIEPTSSGGLSKVHSRSNAGERNKYAEKLRKDGVSPTSRDRPPYDPSKQQETAAAKKTASNGRSATDPGKRKYLVLSSFVVPLKDNVLLRLVKEGKGIEPDSAPFSSNYLNRAILERIVYLYAGKFGVGAEGDFGAVVARVVAHAKAATPPISKPLALILTKTGDNRSAYSYAVLSNGVHGNSIPSGADSKSTWETLQPALTFLIARLK